MLGLALSTSTTYIYICSNINLYGSVNAYAMKITVATYQLHFSSFVTEASHYSDFKFQKQTNK